MDVVILSLIHQIKIIRQDVNAVVFLQLVMLMILVMLHVGVVKTKRVIVMIYLTMVWIRCALLRIVFTKVVTTHAILGQTYMIWQYAEVGGLGIDLLK
jgi:hypothetical protein